jgi:hypothetical protein
MVMQQQKRIPEGIILGEIPLEAAKSYPTKMFGSLEQIRFAISDISKKEQTFLQIKVIPDGSKTSPHPQLAFFVIGDYHIEPWLGYGGKSNPFNWTTWQEIHINGLEIYHLLKTIIDAKQAMEAL